MTPRFKPEAPPLSLRPNFIRRDSICRWPSWPRAGAQEAWITAQKARILGCGGPFSEGQFGYVAGRLGHSEAGDVIADLTGRRQRGYGPALPVAWSYPGAGDLDSGLDWMEIALKEHEPYLGNVAVSPFYDPVRSCSRFIQLLPRVGFRG